MTNLEKYYTVFKSVFNVNEEVLNDEFAMGTTKIWDSITHLTLVTQIEDEFNIMFDAEDILELRSFEQGKEILKKYDITI